MTPFDPLPRYSISEQVDPLRLHGESRFDAAARILLGEAWVETNGVQERMGEQLGISTRMVNYRLSAFGARPKDTEAA